MSIKNFLKNYIIESNENLVSISPENYLELLEDVGGIAERISKLKPYRGKGIVITGSLTVTKYKNIGPLTGVVKIMGSLNISDTNVPNLDGIIVDGYVSDHGSSFWRTKQQTQLNEILAELDEKRKNDEWGVENNDDESKRTEALYEYLVKNNDVYTVEDKEGNEIVEDKYYIYPVGRSTYGYGKQYEWLGDGATRDFNFNYYDVYTEEEANRAARAAVESMLDDMGMDAFTGWVYDDALDRQSWTSWLETFFEDIVRDNPDDYDIPMVLTQKQMTQVQQLKKTINSLNKRLENEDLPEDQYEEVEIKIEGLEETIEEIKNDPQGGYDESAIENEINDRVDEWSDNIKDFVETYGFDKNFIMDFIDFADVAETVINSDGYGSLLNSYDGEYEILTINGTEYYVMRVS